MWEGIDGGHLPIKNYSGKAFAGIMNLVPEKLWEKGIMKGYSTCFGCPIACTKISEIQIGEYKGQRHETPEYEAAVMLGCNCGIDSYEWVTYLHVLCNDLGLDIISAGNTAAFAMECREKGLIDHDIKFGDGESLTKFLKDLAHKEGIGELFHKGVREASKEIGKGSEQFAIHVKGLELPALDPRASYGMSLAFATADRGGCHQRVWTPRAELYGKLKRFSTEGRAEFIKPIQDERAACFSLDLCDFISYSGEELAKLLTSATGFEFSEEDYVHTGERIWNLARMFAVREGISRKDDVLPPRLMEEPITEGPAAGQFVSKEKLDSMLDEYYALRGWDSNGIPTKEKLVSLGLDL
jgi:aldehyde:ferredoxin oxidoreductase